MHSLITTRLDYRNSVLSNLPASTLKRLQRIQNTAARIVSLKPKHCHRTPILSSLHWLPVKQRIMFNILLTIFCCIHNTTSSYLSDLITIRTVKNTAQDLQTTFPYTRSQDSSIQLCGTSFPSLDQCFSTRFRQIFELSITLNVTKLT